jgi:hypothetical protein
MAEIYPMPGVGDVFTDVRGEDRSLRLSYHPGHRAIVMSFWREAVCRGSFRMNVDDIDQLMATLAEMRTAAARGAPTPEGPAPDPAEVAVTGVVCWVSEAA